MNVWFALPTANQVMASQTLPEWKRRGYRVAVFQDRYRFDVPDADIIVRSDEPYPGWPKVVNSLAKRLVAEGADIVVSGGDDTYPHDELSAQEIAERYFLRRFPTTMGVMQPTGDDMDGTDRICGSPWMGREFVRRFCLGRGPFWPEYMQYYADEEMQVTAKLCGLLYQERALRQFHDHWTRRKIPQPFYHRRHQKYYATDGRLFKIRRVAGFPGAEPLEEAPCPTQLPS